MIRMPTVGIAALGLVLATQMVEGQDRARYREFRLGGTLASISALSGVSASALQRRGEERIVIVAGLLQ